ncbi:MAG: stage 0 sporulation protein [Clostridia bacterium]|nr:stage 0 sporulation protein [Clostridia bacterium]
MFKVGVKFVDGGKVYEVETNLEIQDGDYVVVESIRGIEIAQVCTSAKSENGDVKKIIRKATDEDLKNADELKKQQPKITKIANDLIRKYNLDMKIVDVSFTLDGTKVIISYVCEDRVDFRELVKDLAGQLRLRIELKQIGIRDQAKIVGGIGFCGKECCCKKYLNDFDKVSIKMAKTQGLSLNPTKISGICGRLMCCLAYENDFYSEISTKMPKLNARVKTSDGIGSVVYNNLLKQKVTVKLELDNEIKVSEYALDEIEVLPKLVPEQGKKQEKKKEETRKEDTKLNFDPEQENNKKFDNKKKFNKFKKNKNNDRNKK